MSEARWPNARWDDPWRLDRYNVLRRATEQSTPGELFDGFPTENTLEESSKWVHYDREARAKYREMLADTGIDFTNSVVVISYAWGSFATRVTAHQAGANNFKFDTTFEGSGSIRDEAVRFVVNRIEWDNPARFKRSSHGGIHFFFEGLPALDIPEEWWYDKDSGTLYFITPDGKAPNASKLRGKRRDYLLTISDSSHVHVKGLQFHGAAARIEESDNSRIQDSDFLFSAANKFTISNFDMPVTTGIANRNTNRDKRFNNALINCSFRYLDGNAFEGRSTGLLINNVLIYRTQQTTLGLDSRSMSVDRPALIRRARRRCLRRHQGRRPGLALRTQQHREFRRPAIRRRGVANGWPGPHHLPLQLVARSSEALLPLRRRQLPGVFERLRRDELQRGLEHTGRVRDQGRRPPDPQQPATW
jgi:hypothetical protein